MTEVEWVGFILGKGVRRPAPGKLMAIEKWSAPTNVTALRAFLGFTNYYSSFVKNYAAFVAPLQNGLKVSKADRKAGSHVKIALREIQD